MFDDKQRTAMNHSTHSCDAARPLTIQADMSRSISDHILHGYFSFVVDK